MALGRIEQRLAKTTATEWFQNNEVADERKLARRIVQFVKRHACEYCNKTGDHPRTIENENTSREIATAFAHLRQVFGCHRRARSQSRIDLTLVIL